MDKTFKMIENSLIILFFLTFMTPHGSYASSALTITEEGDVEIGGKNTKNTLKINAELVVSVPIGGVIDWWRPEGSTSAIPANFSICDGTEITDQTSPYYGSQLPDLRHKFTRGVDQLINIGHPGGGDKKSYRGSVDEGGGHKHSFNDNGSRTLPISTGGDNPGRGGYKVQNEDRWTNDNDPWGHIVVDRSYYSERSGNHRHDLPLTDEGGRHSHTFNIIEMDIVPSYVGLLKLMRIK